VLGSPIWVSCPRVLWRIRDGVCGSQSTCFVHRGSIVRGSLKNTPGFQTEMFFRFCVNPACSLQTPAKKMDLTCLLTVLKANPFNRFGFVFFQNFQLAFVSCRHTFLEMNSMDVTGPGKMPLTTGLRLNTLPGLCKWFLFCAWGEMLPC
jgi:hypothetical protein